MMVFCKLGAGLVGSVLSHQFLKVIGLPLLPNLNKRLDASVLISVFDILVSNSQRALECRYAV